MQLVEENVTVRCYGSTRLTVAVNGSHTAWLLPSRNQKDQRAVECELRACHQSRLLEARRPVSALSYTVRLVAGDHCTSCEQCGQQQVGVTRDEGTAAK